jgi:D-alanyl-D-alanine carboxypeptidase (penicillin-binding protein 5/6)
VTPAGGVLVAPATGRPASPATLATHYQPKTPSLRQHPSQVASLGATTSSHASSATGDWAIQVGAFKTPALARAVAEGARAQAPDQLRSAALALPPTAPFGSTVLYRARLAHLSASAATSACAHLNRRQLPCVVVPPNHS